MKYKVDKVGPENLKDFLLNPFLRSSYYGDFLLQKYSKGTTYDEFVAIYEEKNMIDIVGAIDYVSGKIIMKDTFFPWTSKLNGAAIITHTDLKKSVYKIISESVQKAKEERSDEIEAYPKYEEIYKRNQTIYLKPMVFSLLGTMACGYAVEGIADDEIAEFSHRLSFSELVDIYVGDVTLLNQFIEKLTKNEMFIVADYIYPKIFQEAKDYVAAGIFSNREKCLIDYLEKTSCGAKQFTIYDSEGETLTAKNSVSCTGKVHEIDDDLFWMDFETIEKVKYRRKVIYQKTIY